MQKINQVGIEEFITIIEKSFTQNGERQLNQYIEKIRKGELGYLPLIEASLQYVPDEWIEKNSEKKAKIPAEALHQPDEFHTGFSALG